MYGSHSLLFAHDPGIEHDVGCLLVLLPYHEITTVKFTVGV
jgi:hypothetical protein